MASSSPSHAVLDLRASEGELSFQAQVGGLDQRVWFTTDAPVTPNADAALSVCLMPAMRAGGVLTLPAPVSPRLLRTQREFQAIQRIWSDDWPYGDAPLREVEVVAPVRAPGDQRRGRGVAAMFSGGVDSSSTVLGNPDVTHLVFVRGVDLLEQHGTLTDEVEQRLREAAAELGLELYVVATNLRQLSDPLARWEAYYGCAMASVALLLAPLFGRMMIAGAYDYRSAVALGMHPLVDHLWSTEQLEIVNDGGRYSRMQRIELIAGHPVIQRTLRVCWQNPGGAYNCGRCRKCLMTMMALEALGVRDRFTTFPPQLDLEAVAALEIVQPDLLPLWREILDVARRAGREDLVAAVERATSGAGGGPGLPTAGVDQPRADLDARLAGESERARVAQQRLDVVYRSKSWALTRPLRDVADGMRSLAQRSRARRR